MKIGIIGHGFVGEALVHGIHHLAKEHELLIHDPNRTSEFGENVKISEMDKCSLVFICVPTPMDIDGKMDCSIIEDVFYKLSNIEYEGVVVIKSTVTPVHVRYLINKFKCLRITTNPEFLTERVAKIDMMNTEWVIIGANKNDYSDLYSLSKYMWPQAEISIISPEAAMMVKYMCNIWFATKVSLMNEFYKLYEKIGNGDWEDVVKAFSTDFRVGKTHLQVPGPDGDKGWGGKCFPKDINALISIAKEYDLIHNVMSATIETNKIVRTNKNWLNIEGATTKAYKEKTNE
jgi:UDPglucose 6-dehydrogenase